MDSVNGIEGVDSRHPSIGFWTDGPPLSDQDVGNSGIARQLCSVFQGRAAVVLTRRLLRRNRRAEIAGASNGIPVFLYPDSSGLGVRRVLPVVGKALDLLLFAAWLPKILSHLRRNGLSKVFVLCGADGWFLANIRLLQRCGISTDLYLVDDIESSAETGSKGFEKKLVAALLGPALRNASKVWAISPGLAELLRARFGAPASWLPVPMAEEPPNSPAVGPAIDEPRRFVFVGALNQLYAEPLRQLYDEVVRLNEQQSSGPKYELEILCYARPQPFLRTLTNNQWVKCRQNLSKTERLARLRSAWVCFLPYSFGKNEASMVSTSFSCKLLEYLVSGRPILVYSPDYSSMSRYFRENKLILCANSRSDLSACISNLDKLDTQSAVSSYRYVWGELHSPTAIRKRLGLD